MGWTGIYPWSIIENMNNIFLTGDIQVGKSTIINKILNGFNGTIGGFRTTPYIVNNSRNFIMESLNSDIKYDELPLICEQKSNAKTKPIIKTFEEFGVEILKDCIKNPPNIIVMDELGVFETGADNFQKYVFQCLALPIPVLGVIKAKQSPFLDKIRNMDNVLIFNITIENRNEQYKKVKEIVMGLIKPY